MKNIILKKYIIYDIIKKTTNEFFQITTVILIMNRIYSFTLFLLLQITIYEKLFLLLLP